MWHDQKYLQQTLDHFLKSIHCQRVSSNKYRISGHNFSNHCLLWSQPFSNDSSGNILNSIYKKINFAIQISSSPEDQSSYELTLSVTIPDSNALASVRRTASTLRADILLHASETVVPSGIVSALDNLSFLTVLSPVPFLHKKQANNYLISD